MIDYLEQLELDLVDAIDHRQAERARHRRLRRPDWRPVATAAAVSLAIAVVVALVETSPDRERTIGPAPGPIMLQLNGPFTRIDTRVWQGSARGPNRTGILTTWATDALSALDSGDRIPFAWTTAGGSITGCISGASQRSREGRVAWNALGDVTAASGALRGYRGRDVRITGTTRIVTPDPSARRTFGSTRRQPVLSDQASLVTDPPSC